MDKQVVLLAGLPGSGKTAYLCQMFRLGWLAFDDFKAQAFEDCSRFDSSLKFLPLIVAVRAGLRCVLADVDFCKTESREEAVGLLAATIPGVHTSWLFFENEPTACEANVRIRNNPSIERELQLIRDYSACYRIPQGADVLPVVRNTDQRNTEKRS